MIERRGRKMIGREICEQMFFDRGEREFEEESVGRERERAKRAIQCSANVSFFL